VDVADGLVVVVGLEVVEWRSRFRGIVGEA
jgi:hypothetical protein